MLRCALAAIFAIAIAACEKPRYIACYGFDRLDSVAVRLFEVASPTGTYPLRNPDSYLEFPTPPSCGGFDGLSVGDAVVVTDIEIANKVSISVLCSTPVGNIALEEETMVTSLGDDWDGMVLAVGGKVQGGVATIAPDTVVAGCSGSWTFATFPLGITFAHVDPDGFVRPDPSTPDWPDEYTFDQLSPGSEPPVVIVRTFVVDEGTACPALGVESGPFTCGDVFSGYYEPAP
jgi:hypothetical protein